MSVFVQRKLGRLGLLVTTALVGAGSVFVAPQPVQAQMQSDFGTVNSTAISTEMGAAVPTFALTNSDMRLDVSLNAKATVINWQDFKVTSGKVANFANTVAGTPNISVLNRVATNITTIDGMLTSAPSVSVFIANPNGVLLSSSGSFSGGSLLMTTGDIADMAFLAGGPSYGVTAASGAGRIQNFGNLTSTNGSIALIAQNVVNRGTIGATGGEVALVAAKDVTIGFAPGSPLAINVTAGTEVGTAQVDAGGTISGQSVKLAGSASTAIMSSLLKVDAGGTLTATSAGGRVVLATTNEQGAVTAPVMISAPTTGGIDIAGNLIANMAGGEIRAFSGDALTSSNIGNAANGNVTLVGSGAVNVTQVSSTTGAIAVRSDTANATLDTATANAGSVSVEARSGAASVTGNVTAGGNYTVVADSIALGGSGTSQSAAGNMQLTAETGDIALAAGAAPLTLTSNSAVGASGTTTITAAGGVLLGNTALTSKSAPNNASGVFLTATGGPATFGAVNVDLLQARASAITAGGAIAVSANSSLQSTGAIGLQSVTASNGANVTVAADGAVTGSSLQAAGDLIVTADSIALSAANATSGSVQLTAVGGSVGLGSSTAGVDVSVTASTAATISGNVTAGNNYAVRASNIVLGGVGTAQRAGNALKLDALFGDVTLAAGAPTLTLTSNSNVGSAGTTQINAAGTVALGNASLVSKSAPGNLSGVFVTASNGAAMLGTVNADLLQATGSSISATGPITVSNDLALSSTGAISVGDVTATNAANITLASNLGITGGTLTAGNDLAVTGQSVTLAAANATAGSVQLTTQAGNLQLGSASAGGNVFATVAGNATITGAVDAGQSFNVSGNTIVLGTAGQFVSQQAKANIGLTLNSPGGTVTGLGTLQLVSNSDMANGGGTSVNTSDGAINFGPSTLIQSSGGAAVDSFVSFNNGTGALTLGTVTADTIIASPTSSSITATGAITSVNSLSLATTGAMTVTTVQTTGAGAILDLDADGQLTAQNLIGRGAVSADAASMAVDFARSDTDSVSLATDTGELRTGFVTAATTASLTKAGGAADLIVTGAVNAGTAAGSEGTVTINSDTAARLGAGSFGSNVSSQTGSVSITAVGDVTGVETAPGSGIFNRLWAFSGPGRDIAITTLGSGTASLGMVTAARDLTVVAGTVDAMAPSGPQPTLEAVGGNLSVTAKQGDALVASARAGNNATVTANAANVTLGSIAAINGTASGIANLGTVTSAAGSAGQDLVYSAGTIALSGSQSARGKVDLLSLAGSISASPGTTIASNTDSIGGEALILDATGGDIALANATLMAGTLADPSLIGIRLGTGANNVTLGDADVRSIVTVGADHVTFSTALNAVPGNVTLADVDSRDTLNLSANGNISADAITVTGAGQGLTLAASGPASTITLTDAALAPGAIQMTATQSVTGTNITGGSIDAKATNGAITLNAATATAGLAKLTSVNGAVRVNTLGATAGDAVIVAGTDATGQVAGTRAMVSASRDVSVTSGGMALLSTASAGRDLVATGAVIDALNVVTTTGALGLNATSGKLLLVNGAAGTTAALTKTGSTDSLQITDKLVAGNATGSVGNVTLSSATDILVTDFDPAAPTTGFVESKTGSITATAAGNVKGISTSVRPTDRGFDTVSAAGNLSIGGSGDIRADELVAGGNLSVATSDGSLTGTGAGGGTTDTNVQGTALLAKAPGQSVTITTGATGLAQLREVRAGGNITVNAGGTAIGTAQTDTGTVALNTASGAPGDPAAYYVGLLTSTGDLSLTVGGPSAAIGLVSSGVVFDPAFDAANLTASTGAISVSVSKVAQLGTAVGATDVNVTAGAAGIALANARTGNLAINATQGSLNLTRGMAALDATLTKTGGNVLTAFDGIFVSTLNAGMAARLISDTNAIGSFVTAGSSIGVTVRDGNATALSLQAGEDVAVRAGGNVLVAGAIAGDDVELLAGNDVNVDFVRSTGLGTDTRRVDLNSSTLALVGVPADRSNILIQSGRDTAINSNASANATLAIDVRGNLTAPGASSSGAMALNAGEDIAIRAGGSLTIAGSKAADDIDLAAVSGITATQLETLGGGMNDRRVIFGSGLPSFAGSDALGGSDIAINGSGNVTVATGIAKDSFAARAAGVLMATSITAGEDAAFGGGSVSVMSVTAGDDVEVASNGTAAITSATARGNGPDGRRVTFGTGAPVLANDATLAGGNVVIDSIGAVALGIGATAPTPAVMAANSIAVLGGGTVTASSLKAGEDIAITSAGLTGIGMAEAGDDLVLTSAGGVSVGTAKALGTPASARTAMIAAAANGMVDGGIAIAAGDTLGAGGVAITTNSGSNLTVNSLLEGASDVRIDIAGSARINTAASRNAGIDAKIAGDLTGLAAPVAFGAGTGLRIGTLNDTGNSAVTADTGDVRIGTLANTGGNVGVTATMGSVTGLSTSDVAAGPGAVLTAGSSINAAVGNRTALTSAAAGTSVTVTSATISAGTVTAGSTLAMTATGDALSLDTGNANGATLTTRAGSSAAMGLTDAGVAQDKLTDLFGAANISASGAAKSVTVSVNAAAKGAQLGTVSATKDVTITAGAISATNVTAGAGASSPTGAIAITANTGGLYLGTGTAKSTTTLIKTDSDGNGLVAAQIDRDELRVRNNLTAGGAVTISSQTSNRLAGGAAANRITSTAGSIAVTSTAQTTGIGAGSAPSSDLTHGRADLVAAAAGQDVTVTSGNLAQLGTVTAGRNVTMTAGNAAGRNGAIDVSQVTATSGAIALTTRAVAPVTGTIEDGDLIVGTATAGTTTTLSSNATGGTTGDIIVNQGLTAGGNVAITSAANARLAGDAATRSVTSTAGKIDISAVQSVTGIAAGSAGGTDAGFGRANFVAAGAGQDVTVTAGALTQAGTVSAGRNVDIRSGSSALGNGAIDVSSANAQSGSLLLLAQANTPTTGSIRDGDIILGTGNAGTTATITNTAGLGAPGSTLAASLAGNTGDITVTGALSAGQQVTINAANGATLGATTSRGANVFIQSNQIALNGMVTANGSASEVRLVNRIDTGNTRVNGTVLGNGGTNATQFVLEDAEIDRIAASRVVIETAQNTAAVQDVTLGSDGISLTAATGSNRFEILATSPNPASGPNPTIALNGRLSVPGVAAPGSGGASRTVQIGGSGGAFGTAETAAEAQALSVTSGSLSGQIIATSGGTTGGRIDAPNVDVELRAQRVVFGTAALRDAVNGLSPDRVALDFVSNANSLLFDSRGGYDGSDASQTFLTANRLTIRYRDFALLQNTAPRGLSAGVALGPNDVAASGVRLSLFSGGGFPNNNAFAMFGRINSFTGQATGLQPEAVIQFTGPNGVPLRVNQNQSRLNGCVLGAPDKGCLTTEAPVPQIKLFDERQLLLLSEGAETPLDFDPLVSANNESLFVDFGGFAIDPTSDEDCQPGSGKACTKPEGSE